MAKPIPKTDPKQLEYSKKYYERHRAQVIQRVLQHKAKKNQKLIIPQDKPLEVVSSVEVGNAWGGTREVSRGAMRDPRIEINPILRPEVAGDSFIDLLKPSNDVRWFNSMQSDVKRGSLVDDRLPE